MNLQIDMDNIIRHKLMNNFTFIYDDKLPGHLDAKKRTSAFDMIANQIYENLEFQTSGMSVFENLNLIFRKLLFL